MGFIYYLIFSFNIQILFVTNFIRDYPNILVMHHPFINKLPLFLFVSCYLGSMIQNLNSDLLQIFYKYINMSSPSGSVSPAREKSKEKSLEKHKLFVTNLDGTANQSDLIDELRRLFEDYGKVKTLSVRRSKNGEYSYGFVEYELGFDAQKAVENLNGREVKGKSMKVEFQDDTKRRKDPNTGCYNCGKMGHFARQCHSKNGSSRGYKGRSRSRSRSNERSSRRRRRSPSQSEERDRSRHKKKKQKKNRSRDKDQKKKKKHKKRGSSSDS